MRTSKERKDQRITIRCTTIQKKELEHAAHTLGMHPSTYICDKLFDGKDRNKYARRIMCKTLVTVSKNIDEIYNLIEESSSDYIEINKILPILDNARLECEKLWNH